MRIRPIVILFIILIVGFALRLSLLLVTDSHSTDGISYLFAADYLKHPSEWLKVPPRILMPLFPFLVYLFSFFSNGDLSTAARCVNMVVGMLLIISSYYISSRLFNIKVGLLSALFVAIAPVLIKQSTTERADLLFSLFSLILAYYFRVIPWEKTDFKKSLFFGFIVGASQLVRPNAICFLLIFFIYWFCLLFSKRILFKNFITRIIIPVFLSYLIVSLIPITYLKIIHAPPVNYISHAYLDGLYTAQGSREHDWFQLNEDSTGFARDELKSNFMLSDYLNWKSISTKYTYAWFFLREYLGQVAWDYFQGWSVLIGVIFLFLIYLRKEVTGWNTVGYLLSFFIPFLLILPLIQLQPTYLLPLHPFILIIISWIIAGFSSLKQFGSYGKFITAVIIIALTCTNIQTYYMIRMDEAAHIDGYQSIGLYIKSIAKPGESIMGRNNTTYFYARMQGYPLPSSPLDQTIKFCHNKGIKYVVFGPDERYIRSAWEKEILNRIKKGDTTFELIHKEIHGQVYYVFKINP